MFQFQLSKIFWPVACAGSLGFFPNSSPACGPDFPNAYLVDSAEALAGLPTLCFAAELDRLLPSGAVPLHHSAPTAEAGISAAERAEVHDALAAAGIAPAQIEATLKLYTRDNPPAKLPKEFQLYAKGARAWHAGQTNEAIAAWRELLALPSADRYYRTVWADYMIGRALWATDGDTACASFRAVRMAAKNGFADSEGLATASLGWEARVHYQRGVYPEALRLYFDQYSAGDPSALTSLQFTVQRLFSAGNDQGNNATATDKLAGTATQAQQEAVLQVVAADRQLRGIVTAWFVARGGPHIPWSAQATGQFRLWLQSLPHSSALTPGEADRWAWAAYQNGLWSDAASFAQLAAPNAAASEWVRAMLLLRTGAVAQAADHLAGAAHAFPEDSALTSGLFLSETEPRAYMGDESPAVQLSGVRGVLALQREQYIESLRLFLTAGHWADAAYVAERVLSINELSAFVLAEVPAPKAGRTHDNESWNVGGRTATANRDLRHLLARRLVRAGQFERARGFFPGELVAVFDDYVSAVRTGYREDLPAEPRARALWKAAGIIHEYGMELQGTELEPDYAISDGSFEWPAISRTRNTEGSRESRWNWYSRKESTGVAQAVVPSEDEFTRTGQVLTPGRRFHYRQRAAELAFLSATLLPNDSEMTAMILNTAGRWIAARYPDDAELFYKTLVFRCPHTSLGRQAAARRWLVPPSETEEPGVKI